MDEIEDKVNEINLYCSLTGRVFNLTVGRDRGFAASVISKNFDMSANFQSYELHDVIKEALDYLKDIAGVRAQEEFRKKEEERARVFRARMNEDEEILKRMEEEFEKYKKLPVKIWSNQ